MHEKKDPLSTASEPNSLTQVSPSGSDATTATPKTSRFLRWSLLVLVLLIAAAGWYFWRYQQASVQRVQQQEEQLRVAEEKLQQVSQEKTTLQQQLGTVETQLQQIESRVHSVESNNQTLEGQKKTLQAEVQRFSRVDQLQFLTHIEQTLILAAQQLSSSGNTQNMIVTLDFMIASIKSRNTPEMQSILVALEADKAALIAYRGIHLDEVHAKMDALIAQAHSLPLKRSKDEKESIIPLQPHVAVPEKAENAGKNEGASASWWQQSKEWFGDFGNTLYEESKGLVVVRERATVTEQMQAPILRLQLENRLLQSQFALLARNQQIWQSSLQATLKMIEQNFAFEDASVHGFQTQLKTLESTPVAYAGPTAEETVRAIRLLAQSIRSASE